ncbi:MAG: hypothetical protein CVV42_21415, partial [Candidatus Riflebacteria bacterium HGW-Riflebacteria-2]
MQDAELGTNVGLQPKVEEPGEDVWVCADEVEYRGVLGPYLDVRVPAHLVAGHHVLGKKVRRELELRRVHVLLVDLRLGQQAEQRRQDACAHHPEGHHLEDGLIEVLHGLVRIAPHVERVDSPEDGASAADDVHGLVRGEALACELEDAVGAGLDAEADLDAPCF